MQENLKQFRANLDRVRAIHQLYLSLSATVAPILDLTDLLRAEVVLIVSALDQFVHELVRKGMLEIWNGSRNATPAFERFSISLGSSRLLAQREGIDAIIDAEIRQSHSWKSFQQPDHIADAIRLYTEIKLWKAVSDELGMPVDDVKKKLAFVVDRRNKIAHEADLDPTFPGQRWAIDKTVPEDALGFIQMVGEAICKVTA